MALPHPHVPGGRFRPSAYVGEAVPFTVTAFREGHDRIGVHVRLFSPSGDESLHRLSPLNDGFDRWSTLIAPLEQGVWRFRFEAFADEFATWEHAAEVKIAAGVDSALMREMGAQLFDRARGEKKRPGSDKDLLYTAARTLRDPDTHDDIALQVVRDPAIAELFALRPVMALASAGKDAELLVERERAGVGAWYEFFPRSEGATRAEDGSVISGTFRTAVDRLPGVAAMGFDVLYLPPIHPIGEQNRKGPNNTLVTSPGDPGSPWAIGGPAGGHDAVHPDLGTLEDFRAFVDAARDNGIEVALDLALQASPDHPWVAEHPEWFTTLPDGSIAYAENPPKKYQDIYPVNFDKDPDGIRAEVLRIVRHWIAQGVRIFRVDNPHTKPLQFWEWLIATVSAEEPDAVFLAEAFTRPAPLQGLAMAGFQQSYTYFTWRNTKEELEEFFDGLAHETADFLRPNLFVNTPDILTEYLQFGGRPAYKIRAALAATAAPTYGVYAGYELYENVARPGSEENIDNEKYEYKFRDWAGAESAGDSLAPYLRRLNGIRRDHPALRQLRNLHVQWSDDDAILVYAKHLDAALSPTGVSDTVVVVANVDPHSTRETTVHLDTTLWGVEPGTPYEVEDLITGAVWTWADHNFVRLDAFDEPVHILHVKESR
ncbi:MAG: alpha-1,4-glucan--maltose-1-phosphate maltosyltransferase [Microbacterium sp. 71-36]|uniref:alpha-1,4-glucan--maltose-1-phosphate maltosyltransferase n=1 Tax=unclassified Microbacterium TaxID=2609290 RepID=UPI000869957F|nr:MULTISPECIES: alpha-1,4-glucan--maltose-1-phosphate maltosyltransferase [unclassified Microbacterium]MBN9211898.1 alpha-1,4-glucan--maltose-1-phosphate maltosyltransferase [Microbacterium sp.]ODT36175.1 MAG: alpha-1,4-glucan--maltose-1-phosphate maltosyltransferase [Microbacterium sp. SCN 71-17]OJV78309.1 MAG: alpha-1,4-glucan--maltose-1-phosphate maltosyltransferase [Microbacterium sp. 71-36]